jgi:hypothetical protein
MTVFQINGNVAKEHATQINNFTILESTRYYIQLQPELIKDAATTNDESRWACLDALQCPDTLIIKNSLKEKDKLLHGLIKWVVQDEQYARWQNDENVSLLWINGGPGKGKTMMAISIIEQLEGRPFGFHQQRPVVAYFFCQKSDSKLSTIKGIIKGLIGSLLEQESELYETLGSRWNQKEKRFKEDLTTWQALWNVLVKMLDKCKNPRVYVVIDALDECHEQDKCQAANKCEDLDECEHTNMAMILRKIVLVGLSSRVKWLVTSRLFHNARRELLTSSDQVMINLDKDSKHVAEAVKGYVAAKVFELQHRYRYDPDLRRKLEAELVSKAGDTYLWVSSVCARLRGVKCDDVLTVVKDTPPRLTTLYGQSFDELREGKSTVVEKAMRLLKAMLTVYRPLTGEEIERATDLHLNHAELDQLVDRCAPFVTRRGDSIVFVHQSARDYLTAQEARMALSSLPSWSYSEITGSMEDPAPLASKEYALTFWAQYLTDATEVLRDHGKIVALATAKLLEWLESLRLLDNLPEAFICLANAHQQQLQLLLNPQLSVLEPRSLLPALLHDALATHSLLRHYYTIARWPVQIYGSAILLNSQESVVGKRGRCEDSSRAGSCA